MQRGFNVVQRNTVGYKTAVIRDIGNRRFTTPMRDKRDVVNYGLGSLHPGRPFHVSAIGRSGLGQLCPVGPTRLSMFIDPLNAVAIIF